METNEKILINAVLVFPVKGREVLMAVKKAKIGKGRWNGYGGGIEDGETPEQAACRELKEESGGMRVEKEDLEKAGVVDFHNTLINGSAFVCRVHVYLVKKWTGEPETTEEMENPTWFDFDNLPFENMLAADKEWLPIVLKGEKIFAKAKYGPFQKESLGSVEIQKWKIFK